MAKQFFAESIYTEKLRKKGIRYDMSMEEAAMRAIHVEDLQRSDVPVVLGNQHLKEVIHELLKSRSNVIYVVEQDGRLIGSVDIHDLKEFFNEKDLYSLVLARDIATPTAIVYPEQSLIDVMDLVYNTDVGQLPVVKDPQRKQFLGVITRRDVIGAYNREVLKKKMLMSKFVTKGPEREGIDYVEMPAGYKIEKIPLTDQMKDKTLGELNFRTRYHLHVLEVLRQGEDGKSQRFLAAPGVRLKDGDSLIVIGTDEDFQTYHALITSKTEARSASS